MYQCLLWLVINKVLKKSRELRKIKTETKSIKNWVIDWYVIWSYDESKTFITSSLSLSVEFGSV